MRESSHSKPTTDIARTRFPPDRVLVQRMAGVATRNAAAVYSSTVTLLKGVDTCSSSIAERRYSVWFVWTPNILETEKGESMSYQPATAESVVYPKTIARPSRDVELSAVRKVPVTSALASRQAIRYIPHEDPLTYPFEAENGADSPLTAGRLAMQRPPTESRARGRGPESLRSIVPGAVDDEGFVDGEFDDDWVFNESHSSSAVHNAYNGLTRFSFHFVCAIFFPARYSSPILNRGSSAYETLLAYRLFAYHVSDYQSDDKIRSHLAS